MSSDWCILWRQNSTRKINETIYLTFRSWPRRLRRPGRRWNGFLGKILKLSPCFCYWTREATTGAACPRESVRQRDTCSIAVVVVRDLKLRYLLLALNNTNVLTIIMRMMLNEDDNEIYTRSKQVRESQSHAVFPFFLLLVQVKWWWFVRV